MVARRENQEARRALLRRTFAAVVSRDTFQESAWVSVCREANVSHQVIRYYYGNLQGLLWAVISHHMQALLARLEAAAPDDMPAIERLPALAHAYADGAAATPDDHTVVLRYRLRLAPHRWGDAATMQRWLLHPFRTTMAELLPPDRQHQAAPLALSLLALLNGQSQWLKQGGPLARRDYVDMAVRMLLAQCAGPAKPRRTRPRTATPA